MSCCKNNGTFLTRSFDDDFCGRNHKKCCNRHDCCDRCDRFHDCDDCDDWDDCDRFQDNCPGISCPNINNNDCSCKDSLREVACKLTNQRVIIHVQGCRMCVVIVSIGKCFIKAINPCSQKVIYFNLNRIDNIEDVLPRCNF